MNSLVGVLAAAGAGTRFGAHKLLAPLWDGTPMGVAAARNLIAVVPACVAVVRDGDRALAALLESVGMQIVWNTHAEDGLGASIACGVRARRDARGWLIALADMPAVQPDTIQLVANALAAGAAIAAPVFRGRRGHPVGFSAEFYPALVRMAGETGARSILEAHPDVAKNIRVADPGVVHDIDRRSDLQSSIGG
ncbi:MAG: nucleotidyltransferase family protein [Gammaproteobacteria bacterium]|nr:nucleotidyltransferase family protein [Gammaproteobacteria bacterium]